MMKLVLIRHAESDLNQQQVFYGQIDAALSEKGQWQAIKLSENYMYDVPDILISSNMKRAIETARPLANNLALKMELCQDLREMDFGSWEGHQYSYIDRKWHEELRRFYTDPANACIPGGESIRQVEKRSIGKIREIINEYQEKDKVIGIVSHGIVIKLIIAHYMGIPLGRIWSIRQDNTAVNVLRFDDGYCTLELLNGVYHKNIEKGVDKPHPEFDS